MGAIDQRKGRMDGLGKPRLPPPHSDTPLGTGWYRRHPGGTALQEDVAAAMLPHALLLPIFCLPFDYEERETSPSVCRRSWGDLMHMEWISPGDSASCSFYLNADADTRFDVNMRIYIPILS